MIRSNLCDYSDAYILVKGTTAVPNTAAAGAAVNKTNKKVIFKNCAPFTDSIPEIDNTEVDYTQNKVMPMFNLMEYIDVYLNKSGSLWQYCTKSITNQAQNRYLDFLIDPSFQWVNRLFVLSLKDDDDQEYHKQY